MRKAIAGLIVTFGVIALVLMDKASGKAHTYAARASSIGAAAVAPMGGGSASGGPMEAEITGSAVPIAHGIVQVEVTLMGTRIVDVRVSSLPHDNPTSWRVSNIAAPKLRAEVIKQQSAKVDTVSGATYTSKAYMKSLQAALDAAAM